VPPALRGQRQIVCSVTYGDLYTSPGKGTEPLDAVPNPQTSVDRSVLVVALLLIRARLPERLELSRAHGATLTAEGGHEVLESVARRVTKRGGHD